MGVSLAELTADIREINVAHGWRPAGGGPGDNTFGDYVALLHSEVSEALEAYRDHRLGDATQPFCADVTCSRYGRVATAGDCSIKIGRMGHKTGPGKPEGVGSELADVAIRLLDMCDVFGLTPFDMDCELADVATLPAETAHLVGFGDWCTNLHKVISLLGDTVLKPTHGYFAGHVLRRLATMAEHHGIDLTAEVERKIAYNRTRKFRHGGRHL